MTLKEFITLINKEKATSIEVLLSFYGDYKIISVDRVYEGDIENIEIHHEYKTIRLI